MISVCKTSNRRLTNTEWCWLCSVSHLGSYRLPPAVFPLYCVHNIEEYQYADWSSAFFWTRVSAERKGHISKRDMWKVLWRNSKFCNCGNISIFWYLLITYLTLQLSHWKSKDCVYLASWKPVRASKPSCCFTLRVPPWKHRRPDTYDLHIFAWM